MDFKYLGGAVLGFWDVNSGRQGGIADTKEREKNTTRRGEVDWERSIRDDYLGGGTSSGIAGEESAIRRASRSYNRAGANETLKPTRIRVHVRAGTGAGSGFDQRYKPFHNNTTASAAIFPFPPVNFIFFLLPSCSAFLPSAPTPSA